MTVTPATALYDEPVTVTLTGLGAGRETTVTAQTTDAAGVTWTSSADFRASKDGSLDLSAPPSGGSYAQANPMGLFQMMRPDRDVDGLAFDRSGSYQVVLKAEVRGRPVATATATRLLPGDDKVTVTPLTVSKDGLHGRLALPKDTRMRKPAVLLFGGAEGGLPASVEARASLLAAHGYPALALAYWDAPGLPRALAAIPLEYFAGALEKLRMQPGVDPDKIFVDGTSWGGEAALLLGATFTDVHGVIAQVPNSYVDAAVPSGEGSSWTLNGRGLPHAERRQVGSPASAVDPRAWIRVDQIVGPILLTCGGLDAVWNSCRNVDDVRARLPDPGTSVALRFPDGGHLVGALPAYLPWPESWMTRSGGKLEATLAANATVQRRILELLAAQ